MLNIPTVFEPCNQPIDGPANFTVNSYDYLRCSTRIEAVAMRSKVEEWVSHLPEEHVEALVNRIRSGDNDQFDSAIFELAVHEAFSQQGCKLLEIEAEVKNGRRPDYLFEDPRGKKFYVEAKNIYGVSKSEQARAKLRNEILDHINKITTKNIFLIVHFDDLPDHAIQYNRMKNEIENWLSQLQEDASRDFHLETDAEKKYIFRSQKFEMTVKAVESSNATTSDRSVGAVTGNAAWVAPQIPIRNAIKKKSNKFGNLDYPLIIAVNILDWAADFEDVVSALFGQMSVSINVNTLEYEHFRNRDGAWRGVAGLEGSRCSAIFCVFHMEMSNIGSRKACLIHHPQPRNEISTEVFEFPQFIVDRNELKELPGKALHEILGLAKNWPQNLTLSMTRESE
ncbi:hypothetical protein [Parvularcula sp. LCG005]|uniref:hypothetical protein n=1 Tax=Parvularcula sp. LCG005 TaxID=3078805 RepID=UPI0029422EC4|nr:hypothetical protein [Parvularcula sp. LCG005]WOI53324.1 hypothetical protein RUI03_14355 [Parvularcula sp. LCG005]